MGRVRSLAACLAVVVSVAACGGTEALTAPDAARFDGGMLGSGNATSGPALGSGSVVSPNGGQIGTGTASEDAGSVMGSGGVVQPAGGQMGSGNDVTSDGDGVEGSGGVVSPEGGQHGAGT